MENSVVPHTGIVLWTTNPAVETAPIQLEYAYMTFGKIVTARGAYDWKPLEILLNSVASRGHQLILRWHETYVGQKSGVPNYIQNLPDYRGVTASSEGKPTGFSDWSHPELRRFALEFFEKFVTRYDRDPRLCFVQAGFGLWSEYHIYDGPMVLGKTFPDRAFQAKFARHMNDIFEKTPWMISVDAAGDHAPFAADRSLRALNFGVFDDSFNHRVHERENAPNWKTLGLDRWKRAPAGGEFSFFETRDQTHALAKDGPHGVSFEKHAARFHVSFLIGDSQPEYQKPERIARAGAACGYRFVRKSVESSANLTTVTVTNDGIAPIYHDAFVAVNGRRTKETLRGLLPGKALRVEVPAIGADRCVTIESDRLAPGQKIGLGVEKR